MVVDESAKRVRIAGGKTQLDLLEATRPLNLFLSTHTAGPLFTIAGVIANSVHGGSFGESYINGLVTRLRVMFANGTVAILEDEVDLRYWRNSFGLLGFITAAEFRLTKRENFRFETLPITSLPSNQESLEEVIEDLRSEYLVANWYINPKTLQVLTLVEYNLEVVEDKDCVWRGPKLGCVFKGRYNECRSKGKGWKHGCKSSAYHWKKKDPVCSYQPQPSDRWYSDRCRAIPIPTTNEECTWNSYKRACNFPRVCSFQNATGDSSYSDSCRLIREAPPSVETMIASYAGLKFQNPHLAITGVFDSEDDREGVCLATNSGQEQFINDIVFSLIPAGVEAIARATNDGYYVLSEPYKGPFMAYGVPLEKLSEVLSKIIAIHDLLGPLEFRLMDLKDQAVLQPGDKRSGTWAIIDVLHLAAPNSPNLESWRTTFLAMESIFIEAGGFAHSGKIFGMGVDSDGTVQPFVNTTFSMFTSEQVQTFETYRKTVDPDDLLLAGYAAKSLLQ